MSEIDGLRERLRNVYISLRPAIGSSNKLIASAIKHSRVGNALVEYIKINKQFKVQMVWWGQYLIL
jgi:hypothetical protein